MIPVTIVMPERQQYPTCRDMLELCPEIEIIACPDSLLDSATWQALGQSQVLLLDEAVLDRDGAGALQTIHASYPDIRPLLVVEQDSLERAAEAFSLGINAVMVRPDNALRLREVITTLAGGQGSATRSHGRTSFSWPEHDEYIEKMAHSHQILAGWDKLH